LLFLIQNHKDRRIQQTSDWVHLSTVANSKTGNPPWLNIGSAGWLNIQSAPTIAGNRKICRGQWRHWRPEWVQNSHWVPDASKPF
jgi:hypothetical protein